MNKCENVVLPVDRCCGSAKSKSKWIDIMISFIIIGRNEGEKLRWCVQSVKNVIKQNNLPEYEIIYVDSKSTDDSIKKVKQFEDVKIIVITGEYNAAIGRNIGYQESNGEYLFFIDGDMELLDFYSAIFDSNHQLKYHFVSGDILNYLYDSKGKYLGQEYYFKNKLSRDSLISRIGGLFCIKRKLWEMIGGMNTKYRRSQDLDFGLRLAKQGIKLLRKKETFVIHHTIGYSEKNRLFKILLNGDFLYKGLLYRDHLFNRHIFTMLLRWDYTFLLLLAGIGSALVFKSFVPLLLYIVCVLIRASFRSLGKINAIMREFLLILFSDVQVLWGLFLFYPRRKKIMYSRIK